MMGFRSAPLMVIMACSGTEGDSSVMDAGIRIVTPADGAWFDLGDEVALEAEAWQVGGEAIDLDTAVWAVDGWTEEGNPLLTSELPPGNLTLQVRGEVDGETLTDSVEIAVWAK